LHKKARYSEPFIKSKGGGELINQRIGRKEGDGWIDMIRWKLARRGGLKKAIHSENKSGDQGLILRSPGGRLRNKVFQLLGGKEGNSVAGKMLSQDESKRGNGGGTRRKRTIGTKLSQRVWIIRSKRRLWKARLNPLENVSLVF